MWRSRALRGVGLERESKSNWEGRKEGQAKQGGLGLRKAAICLAVLQMPLALLQARCRVCFRSFLPAFSLGSLRISWLHNSGAGGRALTVGDGAGYISSSCPTLFRIPF